MTGNMSNLLGFKEFDGGYVTFGGGAKGGRITGKGTLKTGKLDFEDVYFVKELQFNLFSVSQMCDKKNSVLFTDTGCFILSPDFKLADESQVLLKVPRKNNMYSVDMKNIIPKESLTCLVAKATLDESMLWHRRLGHDASNDEPQPSNNAGKKDNEGGIDDQERTKNSAQDVNTVLANIKICRTNFKILDKCVDEILKKFGFLNVKTASTPWKLQSHCLQKDAEAEDVDVHLYRLIIGSLMYLTASKPDTMFVVCACARFQVTPKVLHLHAVKIIFRYLKGQPKLGLWYPKDSPFNLEAYTDSDYAGASLDRKSTTGDCQFLGRRLISWQCKKQTIVANSTTEVEYVVASSCCGQVLWIGTDIYKKRIKSKQKRTKPSTGMERGRKTKAKAKPSKA
ncbi:hypothetical protein Tco_0639086 [Tanacetum coccineum]